MEEFCYDEGGRVQSQVGLGFQQPRLMQDVPACGRRTGLDDL